MTTVKVNIDIDEAHEETAITIHAREWTEELAALVKMIKNANPGPIVGTDGEQSVILRPHDIDFVFAENRKTFAATGRQQLEVKMKLYEVENLLKPHRFHRFSKSVIGNIERIEKFELAFNGNLCVHFQSGNKEYVSRHYVAALKEQIMKGGDVYGD